MSDANEEALEQAYALIEAGKLEEAEALLKPVLEYAPDNVDAWWLYAHAVKDPETARMALNKVLSLDSAYEGAQELLDQLEVVHGPEADAMPEEAVSEGSPFDDFDGFDSIDDEDELIGPEDDFIFDEDVLPQDTDEGAQSGGGRRMLLIVPVLLLILVVVLAVLILNPFGSSSTPPATETSVAQQASPTLETAGVTASLEPTDVSDDATETSTTNGEQETPVVDTVSNDVSASIAEALADYTLAEDGVTSRQTSLGNTLVAKVCAAEDLRSTIDGSMNAIAAVAEDAASDIEALGIELVDCNNDSQALRALAVSTDAAVAFSSEAIDQREYQAQWRPVS